MRIARRRDELQVSQLRRLDCAHAKAFESAMEAALPPDIRVVDIDLSDMAGLDCGGLGALLALRKRSSDTGSNVLVRLRNPSAPVQRLLRLTHADEILTVVS